MSKLRNARRKVGISLQDVANKAQLSRPVIEKAEKGRENIRYESAVRIVNALNELAGTEYTVEMLDIKTSE